MERERPEITRDSTFDVEDLSGSARGGLTRHRCIDCGEFSPPAESSFTLISARFGWRLHRRRDERSGEWLFEWRCPGCFSQFREGFPGPFGRGR